MDQKKIPPIVLAADANYAMPLAVTLRSIVQTNRALWPIRFTVLTDKFTPELEEKVESSLPVGGADILWRPIDVSLFAGFNPTMAHLSKMTFARLLIPQIIPLGIPRVLYIDSDVLVLDSIKELYTLDLEGRTIGAVDDLHLETAFRVQHLDPWISRVLHKECKGLPDVARYFNAGVLLIDLDKWRRDEISEKAIQYLAAHPKTPTGDQDALNAVLDCAWKPIDQKWNFQNGYQIGTPDAAIVHFVAKHKPWQPSARHRFFGKYDAIRKRTKFRRSLADKISYPILSFWAGIQNVRKRGIKK
jgi:lipopolysaccharide biosynthesis glycosyltransferase